MAEKNSNHKDDNHHHNSNDSITKPVLTSDDMKILVEFFDKNKNGHLSDEEIADILLHLKEKPYDRLDPRLQAVLKKFNSLSDEELSHLTKDIHLQNTQFRYAGFTASFARAARYLAFTSDLGEALRPVVKTAIVTGTYVISFGYCIADVAFEAYNLQKRNYVTEKGEPMSMTQCIVERSVFQGIASIALPAFIIHSTVRYTHRAFIALKLNRFQKFGPSICGLLVVPLLPLYLDHPVEHGIEYVFSRYGPWAKKDHQH